MTFGQILSRGFATANRSVTGLTLLFVLFGWYQGASVVVGGSFDPQAFMVQPGQAPPPELALLMVYGCFSCFWIIAMVFGGPWVAAGVMGQLDDRMSRPDQPAGGFTAHAGAYYVRILALTLVLVAIVVVLSLAIGLLNMVISGLRFQPGAMQPQDFQKLNTNPASVALQMASALFFTALGLVFTVANAVVVTEHTDAFTSLGTAFNFLTRHVGDAARLFAATAALWLVIWLPGWTVMLLELRDLPVLVVLGAATALYFPYALLLGMGWGMSLWLARRPGSGEGPNEAETSSPGEARQPLDE